MVFLIQAYSHDDILFHDGHSPRKYADSDSKIAEVPTCLVVGLLFCPAPRGGATGTGDVEACLRDIKSVLSY